MAKAYARLVKIVLSVPMTAAAERDLDLARQRLLQAGQAATAADFAEVERLKQQKEIAEMRAALAAATDAG